MNAKTLAAAALLAALGATAASADAGKSMNAALLGVNADDFTSAQLAQLSVARSKGDTSTVDFILKHAGGNKVANEVSADVQAQNAALAGVAAGQYTSAELAQIKAARKDGDIGRVNFILSGENRAELSAGSTAGKAQLASLLGVNADDYTLAELSAMHGRRFD